MVYSQVNRDLHQLPMVWDKCESMFRYLQKIAYGYQYITERKIFGTAGPEYRCALVYWENNPMTRDRRRKLLVETSDPQQMEMVLLVIIKEAEAQAKANNVRSIQ
jgi:hypothetical protein